ncbi:MAG: glycosyl transferase [Porticoccaceae bacterium]|nr:glycosyl transferase [Porticoccaceae bacterium]
MSWLLVGTFIASFLLTAFTRRLALRASWIDSPNHRSSHLEPTPKAGGIGFAIPFCVLLLWASTSTRGPMGIPLAILSTGAAGLALIGFLDDRKDIPAKWRLAMQLGVGTALLASFWQIPFTDPGSPTWLRVFITLSCLFWLCWMTNLYNFMDGIDGLAASHTIAVSVALAVLCFQWDLDFPYEHLFLLLAASSAGFLILNWPPAKIFMGDTGSAYLGFVLAGLMLMIAATVPEMLWSCLILPAVFITDSTVTLIIRIARGQLFYVAHRSHCYQNATKNLQVTFEHQGQNAATARTRAHRNYNYGMLIIIVLWLFPLAWLAAAEFVDGPLAAAIAYTPLVIGCLLLGAGRE